MLREANGAAEPGGLQLHELCAGVHTTGARIGVASPMRSAAARALCPTDRRPISQTPPGRRARGRRGCSSPEACFAIMRGPAFFRVGAIGIDRPVGEHQLPAFTGPELGLDGVEQDVRRLVRRAELSALLQESPGYEECVFDGAA